MTEHALPPLVWIVDSAYTGERNARIGVAERLGCGYDTIPVPQGDVAAYARALRHRYADACHDGWRRLIVLSGTGEDTIGAIADLRDAFGEALLNVFLASILPDEPDPRLREYHLVASPQLTGANVITTIGVAHNVTASLLHSAFHRHHASFAGLPNPVVGLLVGGNTRYCLGFDGAHARGLGRRVAAMVSALNGSLVITNSRRTPPDAFDALLGEVAHLDCRVLDCRLDGPASHLALLARGDLFVVTGDSLSMCSEVAYTGKPLLIDLADNATEIYHRRIIGRFFDCGAARPLADEVAPWTYTPLDPAGEVAAAIYDRLESWGPRPPTSRAPARAGGGAGGATGQQMDFASGEPPRP